MSKFEDSNKIDQIKADLYSRPNAINGKYGIGQLGLDDLEIIKNNDTFFFETLKMKADLADKMIAEAELQGRNTLDPNVMKELGKKINLAGTPIHKSEALMTTLFNSLGLMFYYAIAIGIWGLVFNKNFWIFVISGIIVGFSISLLFGFVVAFQRTKEKIKEMSFMIGYIWGNLGIVIGAIGLIILIIKFIFL